MSGFPLRRQAHRAAKAALHRLGWRTVILMAQPKRLPLRLGRIGKPAWPFGSKLRFPRAAGNPAGSMEAAWAGLRLQVFYYLNSQDGGFSERSFGVSKILRTGPCFSSGSRVCILRLSIALCRPRADPDDRSFTVCPSRDASLRYKTCIRSLHHGEALLCRGRWLHQHISVWIFSLQSGQ